MRLRLIVATLLVTWAGALAVAQKVTTPEELDTAMKKVQPAMMATQKALKAGNYPEATTQLGVVKQVMHDTQAFWVHHKKDDAVKVNKETIARIEAVEKLLAGDAPDAAAATASIKELGATCRSCHEVYRARDADNNWVLKPGSIGG